MGKIKIGQLELNILWLAIFAAIAMKTWLVLSGVLSFNADEAVVALMARHITQGELPIFFYGQAYMGSLDALLVSFGFRIFGEQIWVLRFVQSLLYLGTVVTTFQLGKIAFGSREIGKIAALLMAVPTVNVSLYTTVTLGGYGEALLLGNLLLICTLRIANNIEDKKNVPWWRWLLWGGMAGVGWWIFGLSLVYSLPAGLYLLWKIVQLWKGGERLEVGKALGGLLAGVMVGAAPWWVYASIHGWGDMISELSGGAIANITAAPALLKPFGRLFNLLLLGSTVTFGLRPPWAVTWLMFPLLPFLLMFWVGVMVYSVRRIYPKQLNRAKVGLIGAVMLTLFLGFIFTPFGNDPSGRYFVPLAVPMALFAADMIISYVDKSKILSWGLLLMILVFNLGGTIQMACKYPPGITTQFDVIAQVDHDYMDDLIAFLEEQNINRGYTNYWVAYPLAFLSQEELIFIPRLPYHSDFRFTPRDDRYAPYDKMVAQADEVAYITTNHPALNAALRENFTAHGITWEEKEIGDYHIFYALSEIIRPPELDLNAKGL